MDILQILSTAIVIGFINGTLPGPILTAIFTQIVRYNLRSSVKITLWAGGLVGGIASTMFVAFSIFQPSELFLNSISLVGGLFLISLAWKVSKVKEIKPEKEKIFTFGSVCAVTFFNGSLWLSWFTIFFPQAFRLKEYIVGGEFIFLLVYEVFWLSGMLFMAFIFSHFRSYLIKPRILPYTFKTFALLLLFFAIQMISSPMRFFLE